MKNLHLDAENKRRAILLVAAILLTVCAYMMPLNVVSIVIFLVAYILAGGGVVLKAVRHIFEGDFFDENTLMSIATIGALILGDFPEAIAVMLFFSVGEIIEDAAVDRSKRSITELLSVKPEFANLQTINGFKEVNPETVKIGDFIQIKPGEKVPLDGVVVDGTSTLNTAALTGESMPQTVTTGDEVLSGSINDNGTLLLEVTKVFADSTVAKILDLVENANEKKTDTEKFITKFSHIYTPIVVGAALLLAIIPPLVFGAEWSVWTSRALVFLVISCPCALVLSVPLAFFAGLGATSQHGVLIKGSNYLEALNNVDTVVFDKTGTLTEGRFTVRDIVPENGISREELLAYTAAVEQTSTHPIARSIVQSFEDNLADYTVSNTIETAGHGIGATVNGRNVIVGNNKALATIGLPEQALDNAGTTVFVAVDNVYWGHIVIADQPKADAKGAIDSLHAQGIKKTVMLTGDNHTIGTTVADALGLDDVKTNLLPGDKVDEIQLLQDQETANHMVAFVGDGINDTPVLMQADVGIAMGGLGSDAAIEAADLVIMDDKPSRIATVIKIARKTRQIVVQNIVFALGIKTLFLVLGAFGIIGMWEAVFADVGVTVLAVLNAMRILRAKYED
ncbi:heavy metal translocating P-type ATPase [Weissella ceti]|uniref:Cd(2+)-exporting ATPase n=1 Tax=Weissella ceti TaxID=759620 RepID=A0ABT3E506_9LACO|nr:heavy metal translocating P-type ATPase [Weissella ceti]MCW0953498.1 heavy metal translocating P-type ATPase [Weissella ceti]QVK12085.1 cadmium-translocating P-type ATPase [Weissella ceti]